MTVPLAHHATLGAGASQRPQTPAGAAFQAPVATGLGASQRAPRAWHAQTIIRLRERLATGLYDRKRTGRDAVEGEIKWKTTRQGRLALLH
jgi:hypothetical protein